MTQYLLSDHGVEGEVSAPPSQEQMRHFRQQIGILEAELKSAGAWLFGGRLHQPDTATVVRMSNGSVLTTDGPFNDIGDLQARLNQDASKPRLVLLVSPT